MRKRFGTASLVCAVSMAAILATAPVLAEESSASAAESVTESVAESTAEAVESMAESAAASTAESAAESTAESVAESTAESAAEGTTSEASEETEEKETPVRPEYRGLDYVTLGEYKGLTVEVDPIEITDAAIETRIDSDIRYSEAGSEVFEEGVVQDGDVANIDFEGKKDGVAFEGGTSEGYELQIGSHTFIDGFEDGLIGVSVGETVDLNLKFPENYGNADLAGQDVVFTVKVNSVKRYKEMSDELADALSNGEAKTVEEYRERVRTMLEEDALESRATTAKNDLLTLATKNSTISEYPQDLVDYYVNDIRSYYEAYASMYGMEFGDFLSAMAGITEEQFPAMAEEIAHQSIDTEFTISAIAETEKLLPEGEALSAAYDALAEEVGFENGAALVAEYGEYAVKYKLEYDAVSDFLYDNANIVEKQPEAAESEAASVAETAESEAASAAETTESEAASVAETAESEAASVAETAESEAASAAETAESGAASAAETAESGTASVAEAAESGAASAAEAAESTASAAE